jgi:DNA polymerase-1
MDINIITNLEGLVSIPFNYEVFAFDTETTSLKYWDVEIDILTLYDGTNKLLIDFKDNEDTGRILHWLKPKFESAKVLIAQNIVFDLKVLYKYGIYPIKVELFDTMIASHLLNENREAGLKFLTRTILNRDVKEWETSRKDRDVYRIYAMEDSINTWDLAIIFKEELKKENLLTLFREIEMPFQWVLLDMEINGVRVDLPKVKKLTEELRIEKEKIEIDMLRFLGAPFERQRDLFGNTTLSSSINFNSNQELCNILFGTFGLKPVEKTPKGNPSVGVKTLEHYKDVPFVQILSKYKAINKLLTAFFTPLPNYIDGDGRIRPQFRDIGTKTGRLSCQNPNLQQLPKSRKDINVKTRECFIVEAN